jgi:hypothetical protein
MIAQDSGDLQLNDSAKAQYRAYQYHPKWAQFFVASMDVSISDDCVLALLPSILFQPTLHCDSGTALIALTRYLYWRRTSCAKHMEPNVAGLNHVLKDKAMSLLYSRNISTTMAFEIRDKLISDVTGTTNLAAPTRKWILANFGTDETMQVCVHTSLLCNTIHTRVADQHTGFSQFPFFIRLCRRLCHGTLVQKYQRLQGGEIRDWKGNDPRVSRSLVHVHNR